MSCFFYIEINISEWKASKMDKSSLTVLLNVTSELIGANYKSVLNDHCFETFSEEVDQKGEKNLKWQDILGVMVCT